MTLSYAHPETGADFDDVGVSNGSTARATTPGRPRRVEAAARGANRIDVIWTAPRDNGEVTLTLNPIPNAARTTTSARRTAAGWRRAWR